MSRWSTANVHVVDRERKLLPNGVIDPFGHKTPGVLRADGALRVRVRWRVNGRQSAETFRLSDWKKAAKLARAIAHAAEVDGPSGEDGRPAKHAAPTSAYRRGGFESHTMTVEDLVDHLRHRQPRTKTKTLTDKIRNWEFIAEHARYEVCDVGPVGASIRLLDFMSDRVRTLLQVREETNMRRPGEAVKVSTVRRLHRTGRQLFNEAMNERHRWLRRTLSRPSANRVERSTRPRTTTPNRPSRSCSRSRSAVTCPRACRWSTASW